MGQRQGPLEAIIDAYKFQRSKAAVATAADLLDELLPVLPSSVCIVPVPTVSSHIRIRGYDHTRLMAKYLASRRKVEFAPHIARIGTSRQVGADKQTRFDQASRAFAVYTCLSAERPYLLVDDVITTNATVHHAAAALRDAGAKTVWVAVLARQALDSERSHLLEWPVSSRER